VGTCQFSQEKETKVGVFEKGKHSVFWNARHIKASCNYTQKKKAAYFRSEEKCLKIDLSGFEIPAQDRWAKGTGQNSEETPQLIKGTPHSLNITLHVKTSLIFSFVLSGRCMAWILQQLKTVPSKVASKGPMWKSHVYHLIFNKQSVL